MLTRTKKAKTKIKLFLPLLILGLVAFGGFLLPKIRQAFAAGTYMTATLTDDSGTVDFSPGIDDAVAQFSFKRSGTNGSISKIYDAKIILRNLPENHDKQLNVTLPVGMYWQDDGSSDSYLSTQLDTSKGARGINKIAVTDTPILGYNYPNSGTREYFLQRGTSAITLNFKIRADWVIDLDYIENAVLAQLFIDGEEAERAHIDVNDPDGRNTGGKFYSSNNRMYVNAGSTYQSDYNYYRLTRSGHVRNQYDVKRPYKQIIITYTIDDPAAEIVLTGTNTEFSLDNSRASEGIYVITRTTNYMHNGDFTIPYAIVIPDDAPAGKTYTVRATGQTVIAQVNGVENRTVDYVNSQVSYFEVLPASSLVTIGLSTLKPTDTRTAINTNYNASTYAELDTQGPLGRFYVNNRGSEASKPLHAKLTFDTSVLGVMNLEIGCAPGHVIETIHIKTDSGVDRDYEINRTCNTYGYAQALNYYDLGLERFDYIKEVEYDFGAIPAGFQIAHSAHDALGFAYTGRILSNTDSGAATMELYEIDDPSHTTGVATTTTKHVNGAGTLDITNHATQIINAGNSLNFSIQVKNWAGTTSYDNTVLTPVMYIRQEVKDSAGNFLPISNLKVKTDGIRGSKDITGLFGEITYEDTPTARVYKIDGRNVPDGYASLSPVYVGETGRTGETSITVSWSVETPFSAPDQQYAIADMFFAQDPIRSAAITTHYMRGDPFGVSGNDQNTIYAATTNYYQVRGWNAIGVENSGKHTTSNDWLTWSDGVNPITIGAAEGSYADMRIALSNNSGVEVPGPTTVYIPIPKTGQNWGKLSSDAADFEFSVALDSPLANPNGNYFTIAYGRNVTPTDNGAEIELQLDKFSTDTTNWTEQDWKEVNCVQIIARDIAANQPGQVDTYDFIYSLKVVDATDIVDGVTDTWRPIYFQQLTNSAGDLFAGWYLGSYVSIKLADGKVSGRLFIDANENGKKDSGENYLQESGWQIDLYDAVSNRLVRSTTTDAQGRYNFIELSMNPESFYAVVTNKYPIDTDGDKHYFFTPKGEQSSANAYNLDNQAAGSKTTTPLHRTARISAISPSKQAGEATYNIGLVDYVATESYSVTLEIDDQDNSYQTRPRVIELTATPSGEDSERALNLPSQPGLSAFNLPRYDTEAEQQSFTISAPDIDGYDKTIVASADGHSYSVSYMLKKYTLTINHLSSDTGTVIAAPESTDLYYGQPYETEPIPDSLKSELVDHEGSEQGTISGDATVNYFYILHRGTATVHHYIENSTIPIADDESTDYDIGDEYQTAPLSGNDIPDGYELVAATPGNASGVVDMLQIDVIYYYRRVAQSTTINPFTFDSIVSHGVLAITSLIGAIFLAINRRR